jgi:hypothetical protein
MSNATAVYAIFDTRSQVENAMNQLKLKNFLSQDISVLFPDKEGTREFAHEKETKAPEGATAGTATGAVLGGAFGWLVGIGSLAIPGVGPFIAAGPIMAALAGAAVGGAVGGIAGALIGMGIPEYEAKRFEGMLKDGHILMSVTAPDSDRVKIAKDIFEHAGGRDIASASTSSVPSPHKDRAEVAHM